jgi:hypothetical protein
MIGGLKMKWLNKQNVAITVIARCPVLPVTLVAASGVYYTYCGGTSDEY